MELPISFPHHPPNGTHYEIDAFKRNIDAIFVCYDRQFDYNLGKPVRCIWGFYDRKAQCYYAPLSATKRGNKVDLRDTTAYSAMPLLKLALDSAQEDQPSPIIDSSTQETMTATALRQDFSQFCAERDAQNTIHLNIVKYALMLCDALQQNYQQRNRGNVGGHAPANYAFDLESSGRKYHKIFLYINGERSSIHCFIDKKTGEIYKPASLKAPAKGVRFNLLLIEQREWLLEHADWAGGYLYMR